MGFAAVALMTTSAAAQEPPDEVEAASDANEQALDEVEAASDANEQALRIGAYVETFYQWNFNDPENGITNYRGFDNRHNSFTLSNVALDAQWDVRGLFGRVTLQVGHTPSTYYLAEPELPGSEGANASGTELWKYLQQAHLGYRAGFGLSVAAGLFLSPIGVEALAVHENWNWSRSNLFFGLPFYHTGVQAEQSLDDRWAVLLAVYNGWNSVVDNNAEKSLAARLRYQLPEVLEASLLYFGGVERDPGALEGRPWRHMLDLHATWQATEWLSLRVHGNGGLESNRFGTSHWLAGATYLRFKLAAQWYLAGRFDAFREHAASTAAGTAEAMFWPSPWVSSGTATVEWRPHDQVSLRVEYRHDRAAGPTYFRGSVMGDGQMQPFVPNARMQDTLTLGATAWY